MEGDTQQLGLICELPPPPLPAPSREVKPISVFFSSGVGGGGGWVVWGRHSWSLTGNRCSGGRASQRSEMAQVSLGGRGRGERTGPTASQGVCVCVCVGVFPNLKPKRGTQGLRNPELGWCVCCEVRLFKTYYLCVLQSSQSTQ